jgi:DNA-directed RNA polymerase specialized sigma24 family protein
VVNTDPDTIRDACQEAWRILMTRQPNRASAFAWLRTVAIREAWALDGRRRCERAASDLPLTLDQDHTESFIERAPAGGASLDDRLKARRALELIGDLPPRKRRVLALFIGGHTYQEIAAITGDSLRTTERQIMRAKRLLDDRVALECADVRIAEDRLLAVVITTELRRAHQAEAHARRGQAVARKGGEHVPSRP